MDHPPFSIAISVYKDDSPVFFDRALESITDLQTIKPNEVVLVVDGPVPSEIDEVIEKYASKYVFNVIRLKTNGGLGNALKLATENAKYDLIARMDSDDVSYPDRFEQELELFKSDNMLDVVGGNITEFIDNEDNIVATRVVPKKDSLIKKYMKKRCAMNHVSVMFKKKSILDAGGYIEWHYNEDYYLWIRMQLKGFRFGNTGTNLVNVRTGLEMYSRRGGKKYYSSEKAIQRYMLDNKMIGHLTYFRNCFKRFVLQRLFTNKMRGWVYRHVARK